MGQINVNSIVQLREMYYVRHWAGSRGGMGEKVHPGQGRKSQSTSSGRRLLKEIQGNGQKADHATKGPYVL